MRGELKREKRQIFESIVEPIYTNLRQPDNPADPRRLRRNFYPATYKMRDFFVPRRPNASKQVLVRLAWSGWRVEGGLDGVWALHQDERKFCRFDFTDFLLKTAENRSILCSVVFRYFPRFGRDFGPHHRKELDEIRILAGSPHSTTIRSL